MMSCVQELLMIRYLECELFDLRLENVPRNLIQMTIQIVGLEGEKFLH